MSLISAFHTDCGVDKQSRDVARVFGRPAAWFVMSASHLLIAFIAEWIGLWRTQYKIEINDTIVVRMREYTPEEEIRAALKGRWNAQAVIVWPDDSSSSEE